MAMSAAAREYYESHFQALREQGAMNAARLWLRQALQYTTVNGARLLPFPSRVPARSVAPAVRSALKKHLVHEYDIAARDGSPLRIVYVRHAPGTWSGGEEVIDAYEVPTEELCVP